MLKPVTLADFSTNDFADDEFDIPSSIAGQHRIRDMQQQGTAHKPEHH
jgi:hypothetical protein